MVMNLRVSLAAQEGLGSVSEKRMKEERRTVHGFIVTDMPTEPLVLLRIANNVTVINL
jgi:hypothetical protein